jgi:hypothetical protein
MTKISTKECSLQAIYHSDVHSAPTYDILPLTFLLIDELSLSQVLENVVVQEDTMQEAHTSGSSHVHGAQVYRRETHDTELAFKRWPVRISTGTVFSVVFRGFPQSLSKCSPPQTVSQITIQAIPSTSSPIHYYLITLLFDAIQSRL